MQARAWRQCGAHAPAHATPPQDRACASTRPSIRPSPRASGCLQIWCGPDAPRRVHGLPLRDRRPPVPGRRLPWRDRPPPVPGRARRAEECPPDSRPRRPADRADEPAHHDPPLFGTCPRLLADCARARADGLAPSKADEPHPVSYLSARWTLSSTASGQDVPGQKGDDDDRRRDRDDGDGGGGYYHAAILASCPASKPGDERRPTGRDREGGGRSEEHTSELQSRQYLVCRLLLEKKKKKKAYQTNAKYNITIKYNITTSTPLTYILSAVYNRKLTNVQTTN